MKVMSTTIALASIVFATSIHAANLVPNRIVSIRFNGFCDGMRLVINHTTGIVTGNAIGCISDPVIGTVGGNSGKGIGVTVMSRTFQFVIDDWSQTWQLYTTAGVLLQSGTWSLGAPAMAPASDAGAVPTGK